MQLKPFWRYFGGKYRAAPRYPPPEHGTIIEPFAGAAGYSLRYPDRNVILVEKYAILASVWRYLIDASSAEILQIPTVDVVADLPASVPQEARWLVGLCMANMVTAPCTKISSGVKYARDNTGYAIGGWGERMRARVASQVDHIRHWRVIEGDYACAPDLEATWFIDPPYQVSGKIYVHGSKNLDYPALGNWCKSRRGQTIVCENAGATWLPFEHFMKLNNGFSGKQSSEVIWKNDT